MTFRDAEEIRDLHAHGATFRELADYYEVSATYIGKIVRGEAHAAVPRCGRDLECVANPKDRVFKGNNELCEACLAAIEAHNRRFAGVVR